MRSVALATVPLVDLLAAVIGLAALVSGVALLTATSRSAASVGIGLSDKVTALYARQASVRNLVIGLLFLGAAYIDWAKWSGASILLVALGGAWAVIHAVDAITFMRAGSRTGGLLSILVTLASAAVALILLMGS